MRKFYTFLLILVTLSLHGQIRFEVDFNTEEVGSAPTWLTPFDGRIFFSATDGYAGREAWVYDPAINQAYRLGDINPAAGNAEPREVTVVDGILYFVATSINEHQLWRLLPNESQAERIETDSSFRRITSLTVYNDAIYFRARYSEDTSGEYFLNRYLLTEETVELVEGRNEALGLSPSFAAMCVHDDKLFLLGLQLDESLQTLITYDVSADSFELVANQITENDQQIWVTDFRSFGDYLIMNIRDPESLNDAFLGVYDAATDSITIEYEEALWPPNPPVRSIEVAGGQLFFLKKTTPRTLVRSYDPATGMVSTIPDVSDEERGIQLEASEEELLIYSSDRQNDRHVRSYSPASGMLTTIPVGESFTDPLNGRTFNVFARLGDNWYYQGGDEINPELFRFQESDETITRLTDIHQGTGPGSPRLMQTAPDNTLFSRVFLDRASRGGAAWVQYDPATQLFETLLPELKWTLGSKLYQFQDHLVGTQVEYEGIFYEAVVYNTISQSYVPTVERVSNCNGAFTRSSGSFIPYNDALFFVHCDGNRIQLYRHQFEVAGAEPVSELADSSLFKGTIFDETIGRLGGDLIFPIGESFSSGLRSDLYRYDGERFSEIDMQVYDIREPTIIQTPNAVYLSVRDTNGNYFPAYLREGDPDLHLLTYEGDTIERLFPLNFHLKDTAAYFVLGNQILRHTPTAEAVELYYDLPDELRNAHSPYLFNGRLYFVASEATFGSELYEVSDLNGTPIRISDISVGRPSSRINSLKDNGTRLFFAADDGLRGDELWSYQPNCFTIDVTTGPSNINWPTGSITATPVSGIAPFSYRWNTGGTTASLQDLAAGFYEVTITDATGCSTSQSGWVETNGLISNTEEEETLLSATVYPNPFMHTLNVEFNGRSTGAVTAELFTLTGRLVRTQYFPTHQNVTLTAEDLPAGIFVLRLRNEEGQVVLIRKVVKR